MVTMLDIYRQVAKTKDRYNRYWDQVAIDLGLAEDDPQFEELVKAMKVSGFLRVNEDHLSIGPTPMPDGEGGTVAVRRPRPGSSTQHPDRLRLAGRARLLDDETVTGSDYVKDKEGMMACAAGFTKAGQPTVHLGVGISDEDKRNWSGANLGSTVVLDADGVARFEKAVDELITTGEEAAKPYRDADRRLEQAMRDLMKAEKARVGEQAAEDRHVAEQNLRDNIRRGGTSYADTHSRDIINNLDPDTRWNFDNLEADFAALTRQAGQGYEHLDDCGRRRRDIRAQQIALLHPHVSVDEARELLELHDIAWTSRYRHQQVRLEELSEKVIGSDREYQGNGYMARQFDAYDRERTIDRFQREIEVVESQAQPVTPAQQAKIDAAWAEARAAQEAYDALAGQQLAAVEVTGQWGTIVMECHQGEEGDPHYYQADVRPAGVDPANWMCGASLDPWRPTPAQLRKTAAVARTQLEQAKPEGWRAPPSGVPDVG